MARSKTKRRVSKKNIKRKPGLKFNRRSAIRLGVIAALAIPAYLAFSAYSNKQSQLHDISTIGQGKPVLVQVHDPQCGQCRQLLSSVYAVIDEFPEIEFRVVNLRTDQGYKFSTKHEVSKITLVYFNEQGRKKDIVVGLQEQAEVRSFLNRMSSG